MIYPFSQIEKKWQEYWERHKTFRSTEDPSRKKIFVLDMYPYPSGSGLHVGHPEGYTATDIFSRYKRMAGFSVLHPIGWDAFGLPAERYAMQTNIHPRITTAQNIATFRRQIKMLGLSYDWDREVDTTDPAYYRWTQWIFLQIYNSWYDPRAGAARPIAELERELAANGTAALPAEEPVSAAAWGAMSKKERHDVLARYRLAYIAEIPVNWCEGLGTVLANEEVDEWVGKGYTVERRPLRQWMMRITAYADRLLADARELDWPSSTLEQQRNWIGRSEGAIIRFPADDEAIPVFTTRPDTVFGATYLVLAPEHPSVPRLTSPDRRSPVEAYQAKARLKSDLERGIDTVKTGEFIGSFAVNPATGGKIPIWIADYVLMGYGTGAIMAVPGHDERDHEFARTYDLPIVEVVTGGNVAEQAFTDDGTAVNSHNGEVSLDGLSTPEAKQRIIGWLEAKGHGSARVQFKLRDWLFSRQRYWGEPIPIIHLEDGTLKPLEERDLPLLLPELTKFQPSGTTDSPLALAESWVNVVDPATGQRGRRETNTMPQWAGSCWYYLRYLDPRNDQRFCSTEKERYWMPIDLYIGGSEHAVLHLMYARFWHKVLFDLGHVSTKEPFMKLRHQGLILGEDSRKMSKSMNNVVNPDTVVGEYGADSMRLFEMFMGPLEEVKPWSTRGVEGVHRFLNRVWRMMTTEDGALSPSVRDVPMTPEQERLLHQTIKKVTGDIETLNFNTAISQMMIFVNEFLNLEAKPRAAMETFVLLLSPFAPHLGEELWSLLGHGESLAYHPWPQADAAKLAVDTFELVVQVNGKVRAKFPVPMNLDDDEVRKLAVGHEAVARHLADKKIEKIVVVRNKLASIVAR